jgi:hypothetical protein
MTSAAWGAFKSTFEAGVGIVRVTGPVTLDTMRRLRIEVARGAMLNEVDRVLCDLRAAVVVLDGLEWRTFTRESGSRDALDVPTGYLVGAEAIDAARAHCARMNARGRISLAFATSRAACRWLDVPALPGARLPSAVGQG